MFIGQKVTFIVGDEEITGQIIQIDYDVLDPLKINALLIVDTNKVNYWVPACNILNSETI